MSSEILTGRAARDDAGSSPPGEVDEHSPSGARSDLDTRQKVLFVGGLLLAIVVMPPWHLLALCLNVVFAYWLSTKPWDWIRKYAFFFLVQTLYLFARSSYPRAGYEENALFRHLVPPGAYFAFLWAGVEVVVCMKLLDFVLRSAARGTRPRFGLAQLGLSISFPFTFMAGPVVGCEELFSSYRRSGLALADLGYVGRKLLWGALQLFAMSPFLHHHLLALRAAALSSAPITQAVDPRILLWLWLFGMSVLLYVIYKGYVDLMLGLSRLSGFRLPEQFWFTLFARDPVEYWQNGNRSVYRLTHTYVFTRFFDKSRITAKAVMATVASGISHAFLCPQVSFSRAALLGGLFGLSGVAVGVVQRLRRSGIDRWLAWADEGPARNALVFMGVAATFTMMSFPRTGFLLMVEGLSVAEWWELMRLLFVHA